MGNKIQFSFFSYSFLLILVLLTKAVFMPRKRDVILIYLQMFEFMQKNFSSVFPEIKSLSVFNDKNHLNALFVECAKKNEVSTLVHQHGYIANKASYFPINANHFLSWGTQAYDYARNYRQQGKVIKSQRFNSDIRNLETKFLVPRVKCFKILIAVNYKPEQIDNVAKVIRKLEKLDHYVCIKLHPSQKFKFLTRIRYKALNSKLGFVKSRIDHLADQFDILVTISSTSALDFLLRGKPVIFLNDGPRFEIPSFSYGFSLNDLLSRFSLNDEMLNNKNKNRLQFLEYHFENIRILRQKPMPEMK